MKKTAKGGRAPAAREQQLESKEQSDAEVEGVEGGAKSSEKEEPQQPTITSLANIPLSHMGQQQVRDAQLAEETARQEQRYKALQHQFNLLQLEVQARTSPTFRQLSGKPDTLGADIVDSDAGSPHTQTISGVSHKHGFQAVHLRPTLEPRLQQLTDTDDIEHFLVTFERIAAACRWPTEDCAFRLIPLLTGKARSVCVNEDIDDAF